MVGPAGGQAPLPVGSLFANRYEIRRQLGQGAYGEVYEAHDRHLGHVVAVKVMQRLASSSQWAEAQVLRQLQSEFILPVWNADTAAGVPYIATALAQHGTLTQHIKPQGVPPTDGIRWMRNATRGTQRTHDANLLHRDIKPDNIFLNERREALLGDFGLACLMDARGHGPVGGTPVTMAPEVSAGGPTTKASDVYSLGATLYALLTGHYPYPRPFPRLRDVAPHVPQVLAQRVEKAIADNPSDRYGSASDFDAALGNLPAPARNWVRTDEHVNVGHFACWRGVADGKADATVCAIAVGTKYAILAQHQPAARRITAACRPAKPLSALPQSVRAAIRAVG